MTLCCAGGVLRLSRQVLFFVSRLPTPICALYTRSRLSFAPNQLIIALLIGSHLFLFFFISISLFLRKTKTSLPLAPGEATAWNVPRLSISYFFCFFLLLSSFRLLSVDHYQICWADPTGCRLSTFHWKSPRSTRLDATADNAEGYAPREWEWERE